MRELTSHKVNGVNDGLTITVMDELGSGGANHNYLIKWDTPGGADSEVASVSIGFQNGPIREAGVNGVTHEALLAVLIDRLEGFQRGPFACDANKRALISLCEAQDYLKQRTQDRAARGVEGTLVP